MFFVQIKKINQNNIQPFDQHSLNMETIFMNTENSKTSESNKCIHQFTDKLNPNNKNIGLINLSIYYNWKNIKTTSTNSTFFTSSPSLSLTSFFALPNIFIVSRDRNSNL